MMTVIVFLFGLFIGSILGFLVPTVLIKENEQEYNATHYKKNKKN